MSHIQLSNLTNMVTCKKSVFFRFAKLSINEAFEGLLKRYFSK